ncbi:MAG: MCE family protein [Gemmatimonadetes bacterium]|nr:MCE family protein [Gemmatimonadota bacterium]
MKRRDEVLVGLTATVALVMGLIGALWLARGGISPGYPLYIKFDWGAGLKQGQPVLLAGVNVGFVGDVELQQDGNLIVTIKVRNQFQVPKGTTATIEPNGFFGDMLIALQSEKPNSERFAVGDTIPRGAASPPLGQILGRVDSLTKNLTALTGALQKDLVNEDGLGEIRSTIRQARTLFAELQKVAAEQNAELTKTQASLRRVANAVDSAQVDSTLRVLTSAAKSVTTLAADIGETTGRLDSLINKVNNGQGTAGRLLNDDGLYRDVRGTLQRLDSLMADFMAHPKKYVKLSIF